jgi:MFS family permease
LPEGLRLGLAFGFGIASGLIPASALAAAPVYAPTPALIGTMSGLMVMGSNTGQLFGPPALAAIRETSGNWDSTLWLLLSLAVAGIVMAVLSRPMENRAATH